MKEDIKKIVEKALQELGNREHLELPEIRIDHAKEEKFGDYSTNIAMMLAGKIGRKPMEIAEQLAKLLDEQKNNWIRNVEAIRPGYINFYLSQKHFIDLVQEINSKNDNFGNNEIGKGKKINNEFISANPTGPLHLGNGRGGFYGDSLGKVLKKNGFEVTNEYYVNDAGEQTIKLAHSIKKDEEVVYSGWYIDEIRKKYPEVLATESIPASAAIASRAILNDFIQPTVSEKMRVQIDSYISEKKDLLDKGYIDQAIDLLKNKNLTFESEEALWLKTTEFGDDKDRVLIKKDGQRTYFASDCGYILNKQERKFDKIIEIWGADHHGYINRFRAASEALGFKKEQVKFIVVQLVRLMKDGKEFKMSKRAGNVVYIDELIDEVGHDVTRFFFLMYSPDTHMNFDLNLAKEKSEKNPVFYVQYAYARVSNIIKKSAGLNQESEPDLSLLNHEKELSLMRELSKFPELVEEVGRTYEVHKLPYFALRLADKFHSFYNDCRVVDGENPELSAARLELVKAVKIVLGETLRLIGVGAPEKM